MKVEDDVVERTRRPLRRLVVPVVLTVTVIGAAVTALSASIGCGDDTTTDAAVDGAPDTPII